MCSIRFMVSDSVFFDFVGRELAVFRRAETAVGIPVESHFEELLVVERKFGVGVGVALDINNIVGGNAFGLAYLFGKRSAVVGYRGTGVFLIQFGYDDYLFAFVVADFQTAARGHVPLSSEVENLVVVMFWYFHCFFCYENYKLQRYDFFVNSLELLAKKCFFIWEFRRLIGVRVMTCATAMSLSPYGDALSYGVAAIILRRCRRLLGVAPSGRAHPKNALRGHKSVSRGQRPREYRQRPREIRVARTSSRKLRGFAKIAPKGQKHVVNRKKHNVRHIQFYTTVKTPDTPLRNSVFYGVLLGF